jgi:hypothetical protein
MSSQRQQGSRINPHGISTFEHVVHRLRLSPAQYFSSSELKEWVRRHKDERYMPPDLLDLWGFEVSLDLLEGFKKPPKRAA